MSEATIATVDVQNMDESIIQAYKSIHVGQVFYKELPQLSHHVAASFIPC